MALLASLMAACALALCCVPQVVKAQCDYSQQVKDGVYYDIANPNYPNKYAANTNCRWYATASSGSRLQLSCGVFDIPYSQNCQTDRVSVSLSGDTNLGDAHVYCGKGTFTHVSDGNRLNMVLQSSYYSTGGVFLCNITASASSPSCRCGIKKQTRIVGGSETGINEYPFMAALVDSTERRPYCGGTILSAHYVATAAHCVLNRDPSTLAVLVGDHDISTGSETAAAKLYRMSRYTIHPNYDSGTQFNDIAVVRTRDAIVMSNEVMPVCLPFRYSNYDFAGQKVEVLGWGTTEYGGVVSDKLMKVDLYVQTNAQCTAVYGNSVMAKQMCTYNNGKDACQMDSGGPVLWQDLNTGREHLVGIISYGIACASTSPGINTRVTSYLDWISNIISSEDQYCVV